MAAVIRDKTDGGRSARKVSLRSTDGAVDVSAIARVHGGGGHRRAAGFGTDMPYAELVEFLRAEVSGPTSLIAARSCWSTSRPASPRTTSSPACAAATTPRPGTPGTLDPFATGLLIVLLGRPATREQSRFMALREDLPRDARASAPSRPPATPTARSPRPASLPEGELELPTGEMRQRPPAFSAVKVGGERAYRRARRGEQVEMPERLGHRAPLRAARARRRTGPSSRSSARRAPTSAA